MAKVRYFDVASKEHIDAMFQFNCEDEFFCSYLKMEALYDKKNGLGTTHLLLEQEENDDKSKKLLGFFTLKNTSLVVREEDEGKRIGYPAIEVYQFATHKDFQRQGIGRIMIGKIIAMADELKDVSAIRYIVLCSVKESEGFYDEMEFEKLDENKKFIPRENCNRDCIPMYRNIIVKSNQKRQFKK